MLTELLRSIKPISFVYYQDLAISDPGAARLGSLDWNRTDSRCFSRRCAPLMLRNSGAQEASEGVSGVAIVPLDSAKRELLTMSVLALDASIGGGAPGGSSRSAGSTTGPGQAAVLSYGGRLYDNHWVVLKRLPPSQANPLYPGDARNATTTTWRCVLVMVGITSAAGASSVKLVPNSLASPARKVATQNRLLGFFVQVRTVLSLLQSQMRRYMRCPSSFAAASTTCAP